MIGSAFAAPSGIANLVLASVAGLTTLGPVEAAAAFAALVAGIFGVVAIRALGGSTPSPGLTPSTSAATEYSKAA